MMELISHEYFSVHFQKFFNNDCTEFMKSKKQQGRAKFDFDRKVWNVKVEEYEETLNFITQQLQNNP